MGFQEILEKRKTTREYKSEKISKDIIDKLLNSAKKSPVGMHNDEGYVIISISSTEILKAITEESIEKGAKKDPLYGVPLVILVCKTEKAINTLAEFDAGIIIENIHLKATELELGSVILKGFVGLLGNDAKYLKMININEKIEPLIAIGIGYAENSENKKPESRKFRIICMEEKEK